MNNILEEILKNLPGGRVLDVATGQGGFIHALKECLPGYTEIIGIDTSERALAAAQEAFKEDPRIRFMQMSAERLDFPDGSFDIVCIVNSLHHLANLPGVLAEMKRVLKADGYWLIMEMYCDGQTEAQLTHVYLHHWWAAVDTALGIPHYETFTRQQIVERLNGMELSELAFYDYFDLSGDPKDEQARQELESVIERYIGRADGLPDYQALKQRGEELRQRVRSMGFHSATELVAVGRNG